MTPLTKLCWLALGLLIAYLVGVALVVTGGVAMCGYLSRRDEMDEAQARAFGALRPSAGARALGLLVEVLVAAFDLGLRALWLFRLLPQPRDPGSGTPVVLLPGYSENAGAMWWFARKLQKRGFRPVLVDFPSTFSGIDQNVIFLRARLAALREQTGCDRIAIVAHSMGGVVARALILSEPDPGVLTLIALASPFRGTHMARVGAFFRLGKSAIDMCPNSAFYGRFLPSAASSVPIRSIVGAQENIVSPAWSSVLPDCETHVLSLPVGHDAPLHLEESYARVESWLLQDGVLRASAAIENAGATSP